MRSGTLRVLAALICGTVFGLRARRLALRPLGASTSSNNCVTTRAALRRLAHAHALATSLSAACVSFKCTYIYCHDYGKTSWEDVNLTGALMCG
jgi:hypothetical protein